MTLRVSKHSNLLCSVIFVNFYNFFSTMTSLCLHLSAVRTGNCKLGHDWRRVCSDRRRDATRQFRLVGVGGVYYSLRYSWYYLTVWWPTGDMLHPKLYTPLPFHFHSTPTPLRLYPCFIKLWSGSRAEVE